MSDTITKEHLKKRGLILPLLKREIERLAAWRNPKGDASSNVPGEESISSLSSQFTLSEKMWRECARIAWKLCPRLCLNLAERCVEYCLTWIDSNPELDIFLCIWHDKCCLSRQAFDFYLGYVSGEACLPSSGCEWSWFLSTYESCRRSLPFYKFNAYHDLVETYRLPFFFCQQI